MKNIKVAAAVICNSLKDMKKVFATARGYGEYKGFWEFPGGKIEDGETPQQALVREIKEELDVMVKVGDLIQIVEYDYPDFHLVMNCYWCEVENGEIKLLEADDAVWLAKNELYNLKWLPADLELIEEIDKVL